MKRILVLIIFLVSIPVTYSINYCQNQGIVNCHSETVFPCMIYNGWCCSNTEFRYGFDCNDTKIYFKKIPKEFCVSSNYLGINGNSTFLNVTINGKYDGVEYDIFKINCTLNGESSCEFQSENELISCSIFLPRFKISESNFLECSISHPTLFLITNSTSINFKTFDFNIRFNLSEIQMGTSIIPIYLESNSIIPIDFILELSTKNKNARIYEETKKTNILSCKEEEKISYLIETISPGIVNLNLIVKPNLNIPCSQTYDCTIFENGKCIKGECWASYDFSINVKSKIQEFDYTYLYSFLLSILALIFIILLVEAIVR